MDEYVIRQQKKLRRGFTTGTCAAAAAKGAAYELLTGLRIHEVTVRLPSGERPKLSVYPADSKVTKSNSSGEQSGSEIIDRNIENGMAKEDPGVGYYCIKDAGDDPDVTNQAKIYVFVKRICKAEIPENAFRDPKFPDLILTGGSGVGKVTKPGLEQKVGQSAVNKVPRRMIFESVQEVLDREKEDTETIAKDAAEEERAVKEAEKNLKVVETAEKEAASGYKITHNSIQSDERKLLLITVCVQNGAEIAQKTFNPKLGIVGGISILGTTGIVEPMSEAALVATIEVEIRQTLSEGQKHLLFVPGNYGEKYVRNELKLSKVHTIQCSNYVGDAIDLAVAYKAESILFVGNLGKLVKLAAGIMNTHSRYADGRWEIIAAHAALLGAPVSVLQEIRNSITTDQMLTALQTDELRQAVMNSIICAIDAHLKHRAGKTPIGAMIYSEKYGFLGQTENAGELLAQFR